MKYYRIMATIKHPDGRICNYRYSMSRKDFEVFQEKVLNPQGNEVISIKDIKEPMKYYS